MTPATLLKFRAVPPAWILPSILLGWALHHWLPILVWLPSPWRYVLAAAAWTTSLVITGQAARTLARHETTIYPNGESTALVTSGIYRHTRNPMYLGMALIVLGAAFLMGSLSALLAVAFFCATIRGLFIRGEEERLEGWFGEEYRHYRRRVRRWL